MGARLFAQGRKTFCPWAQNLSPKGKRPSKNQFPLSHNHLLAVPDVDAGVGWLSGNGTALQVKKQCAVGSGYGG